MIRQCDESTKIICVVNIAIWLWGMDSFFWHDEKNCTNDEVYPRMWTVKALLGDIVRRQLSFLGHVLRNDELEKFVVTVYVDGKRARDRQRETFLTFIGKMKHKLPMELLQMAKNRTVWSKLCTYIYEQDTNYGKICNR